MANRRMGGQGGGVRSGNRSFNQGGGVNPWAGSNSSNQGLISQISNPQQLALALTSLLQPQQQGPPSLLSLNTSPGYNNQDRDFNRFGRGRDFRRHEPYTKNRGQGGIGRRRQQNKDDNKEKKEDGASAEEGNEEGETKRDWKNEKNNADPQETEEEAKIRKEKEEKEGPYYDVPVKLLSCFVCNKEMWDGESMRKHVRGRAHREMLDSLEESIHITVNILRENMRLFEEKKIIELNRMQRVTKRYKPEPESHCNMCDLKFFGKIISHRKTEGHQRLKHYLHPNCRLCSKEFPARMEWIEHRLSPEHLRRVAKHLENKVGGAEQEGGENEDIKTEEGINTEIKTEEGVETEGEKTEGDENSENVTKKDGDDIVLEEENDDLNLEQILDEQLSMEAENPILEVTDNLNGLQNLMPAYKPNRPVATQSLKPFSGFMCEICFRSFVDEDLAQKHLRTKRHHIQFVDFVKNKYKEQQKKEKEEKEAEEKKKKEEAEANGTQASQDGDLYNPDEPTQETALETEEAMETSQDENVEMMEGEEEAQAEEPKQVPATPSKPTTRVSAAAAVAATANVKNGAGPKTKKARK